MGSNISKIALGTVQFGVPYGINNTIGIPEDEEIRKIFNLAFNSEIDLLDTAPGYGDAELKISRLSEGHFQVVSKFAQVATPNELKLLLNKSLENLSISKIYGYLAHNSDILLEFPQLWDTLTELKNFGLIEKIGYSLYQPEQLEILISKDFKPDIVQIPYSLLDRKFEPYFSYLKQIGVEIHIRSVFLQGLYFKNPDNLNSKLKPLRANLLELHALADQFKSSIGGIALNFVLRNRLVDHVIIGVDTEKQLRENLVSILPLEGSEELWEQINDIKVIDKTLLNPANW